MPFVIIVVLLDEFVMNFHTSAVLILPVYMHGSNYIWRSLTIMFVILFIMMLHE